MNKYHVTALLAACFLALTPLCAQTGTVATISSNATSSTPALSNVPAATAAPSSNAAANKVSVSAPPTAPPTFSSEPGSFRSWFIDGTAAIFGVLAVLFALLTVVITVVGIIISISKFRDLMTNLESDLRKKVNEEFTKKLDEIVQTQMEPKVKEIIEQQLVASIDTGKKRIQAEISKTLQDSDLKEALIKEVAAVIQSRLTTPPQGPEVEPKEFDR